MRLVPAIRKFTPETQAKFQARSQFDRVLGEVCALERSPPERRIRRRIGPRTYGACQEARQVGKGSLSVLVIEQAAVGLHPLDTRRRR